MAAPEVPISVDPATGIWSTDGLPMVYLPRHFFVNYHRAVEAALGREKAVAMTFEPGRLSAFQWCAKEAATHGIAIRVKKQQVFPKSPNGGCPAQKKQLVIRNIRLGIGWLDFTEAAPGGEGQTLQGCRIASQIGPQLKKVIQ